MQQFQQGNQFDESLHETLGRISEARLREIVIIRDNQFGFRPVRMRLERMSLEGRPFICLFSPFITIVHDSGFVSYVY